MTVEKLITRRIDKVWGRHDLSPWFENIPEDQEKMGEIWFERAGGRDADLLIKYLFTSEKLSVQVHPDDEKARAAGHKRGKEEAWLILDAKANATVGLGTVRPLSSEELRAAALDGSIEELIDWKPVSAGQFIYSPAGTVHAIGPGITLVEVQQNVDLTYRLYDYGRPRELHLDDAVAASDAAPFEIRDESRKLSSARTLLCEGRKFVAERFAATEEFLISPRNGRPVWVTVLSGRISAAAEHVEAGEALLVTDHEQFGAALGTDLLLAYPGPEPAEDLIR